MSLKDRIIGYGPDNPSINTPLLKASSKSLLKEDPYDKQLSIDEVKSMPEGAFAERLNSIRARKTKLREEKIRVEFVNLVKSPNLLTESNLRKLEIIQWLDDVQSYSQKYPAVSISVYVADKVPSNPKSPLEELTRRLGIYRRDANSFDLKLVDSLIKVHIREVLTMLMQDFSVVTTFKVYTRDQLMELIAAKESKSSGLYLNEGSADKFLIRVWWDVEGFPATIT